MRVSLSNRGKTPLPLFAPEKGRWAERLDPGETKTVTLDVGCLVVGERGNVLNAVYVMCMRRFGRAVKGSVNVALKNEGVQGLSVIPGLGAESFFLAPGASEEVSCCHFLEVWVPET